MRSKPDLRCIAALTKVTCLSASLSVQQAPQSTHIVCGFLGCDARPYNPLLMALPNAIHVRDSASGTSALRMCSSRSRSRRNRESAASAVLGRLSELLFVEVVRRYAESLDAGRTDWLSGLRDPNIEPRDHRSASRAAARLDRAVARARSRYSRAPFSRSASRQFVGCAADAIPGELADAARRQRAALQHRQRRDHRQSRRLRIRSGVQPRVHEVDGRAAELVAQASMENCMSRVLAVMILSFASIALGAEDTFTPRLQTPRVAPLTKEQRTPAQQEMLATPSRLQRLQDAGASRRSLQSLESARPLRHDRAPACRRASARW